MVHIQALAFDLSSNPLLWWDYTWGTGTPWNGTTGIQNKSGFFNITNNGSNVPYMLIPVDAGVNAVMADNLLMFYHTINQRQVFS